VRVADPVALIPLRGSVQHLLPRAGRTPVLAPSLPNLRSASQWGQNLSRLPTALPQVMQTFSFCFAAEPSQAAADSWEKAAQVVWVLHEETFADVR
jgi:hypothetical protein